MHLLVANSLYVLQDDPLNAFGARWCCHGASIVPVVFEPELLEEFIDRNLFRVLPIIFLVMINGVEDGLDEGAFRITTSTINLSPIE